MVLKHFSKNEKFRLKGRVVFSYEDVNILDKDKGCFILDMWNQCEEPDIEALPVKYVECGSPEEFYVMRSDNIIIGRTI